jgi:hypothetical protein
MEPGRMEATLGLVVDSFVNRKSSNVSCRVRLIDNTV